MLIGNTLRWLADKIDPPAPHESPDYPLRATGSVFADETMADQRREDALALMDAETLGYLLIPIRDIGEYAKAEVKTALSDEMWPAIKETLCRIIVEAERVYR